MPTPRSTLRLGLASSALVGAFTLLGACQSHDGHAAISPVEVHRSLASSPGDSGGDGATLANRRSSRQFFDAVLESPMPAALSSVDEHGP